jgi:DNA-binding NarL/FixJ family response regulator
MYVSAQTPEAVGTCSGTMSGNILLILADAAEARAVRRSLLDSRDGPFSVEWVSHCSDASNRLQRQEAGQEIAAIVLDLFLPDSHGIETFDTLSRASPHVPILVLCHLRDEDVARLAVQRGAQDYLLDERLDGYSLTKALSNMLDRSAYAGSLILPTSSAVSVGYRPRLLPPTPTQATKPRERYVHRTATDCFMNTWPREQ